MRLDADRDVELERLAPAEDGEADRPAEPDLALEPIDVLVARGKEDEARSYYREALARAAEIGLERGAIQLKLDNLAATGPADES